MELSCTLKSLSAIDTTDPEALQALLQTCTDKLLNPSLWEWAIVLTLICAGIGALIGRSKGRWLAGFIWGAALGPIGWIVIAVAKREPRLCPECGRKNPVDAKVCHGCGIQFRKYASQTTRSRLKSQDRSRGW
ncbi:MAG TPA: zinc ribbon domain-containing protein [Rhodanobacteraceae bacterium]|nr:zinc ribbon domain-containing protein [Rhodanobacteraceae bacterium]